MDDLTAKKQFQQMPAGISPNFEALHKRYPSSAYLRKRAPKNVPRFSFEYGEVLVLHRLAIGCLPATGLPARHPLRDPAAHILRVRENASFHRPLKRLQRADDGGEFHTIVRRMRFGAGELFLLIAEAEQCGPPSRTRIAATGAIRINLDNTHFLHGIMFGNGSLV